MQIDCQTLLFFLIMLVIISLPNGNNQLYSSKKKNILNIFQQELKSTQSELLITNYTSGYGNITGFKLSYIDNIENKNISQWPIHKFNDSNPWTEDEKYSILPNIISNEIKKFWGNNEVDNLNIKAYYFNISGNINGQFENVKLKEPLKKFQFELSDYLKEYYQMYKQFSYEDDNRRYDVDPDINYPPEKIINSEKNGNITKSSGKISIKIKNYDYNYRQPELAKFISNESEKITDTVLVNAKLCFNDYEEIEDHEIDTNGIYFQKTGSLILITQSAKFLGNYGLPHLTINQENFNKSKLLMSQLLNLTDIPNDITMKRMNSYISKSQEQCEFITYLQFNNTEFSEMELRTIEDELITPNGRPIPKNLPKLTIKDFLAYSPDCGLLLTKKPNTKFEGLRLDILNRKLKWLLVLLLGLIYFQFLTFLRQIDAAKSPGQLSVISSATLFMLGFQDSVLALFFLLVSTSLDNIFISVSITNLYLLLACVSAITFVMCDIFELRFMVSVLTTQVNERGTTWWQILRGSTEREDEPQAATTSTLDANEENRFSNSIFATGFILTIIGTFLILNAFMWRVKYRRIFEFVGLFLINSFWVPQFLRNTLKNRRKSFTWEFILATSIIRVMPIFYLCLYTENPLEHHYDPILASLISCWLLIQIFMLYLQYKVNPRFWINEKWLPKAYDYHKVLNLQDLENGFASDIFSKIRTRSELSNHIIEYDVDCAICMCDIKLLVLTTCDIKINVNNKDYMITPCHHIFHTGCLENWMKYKLQCPVCRNSLPPV